MTSNLQNFIHLRTQSSYSMLESAITINQLINNTKKYHMSAVSLTDKGNLFGSLEFAIAASKASIQPLHGTILNMLYDDKCTFAEILLIAKDEIGYSNLLKLVSYSFIKNDNAVCPHVTVEDIKLYNEGIIALSCYTDGIVGRCLLNNQIQEAKEWSKKLKDLFSNNLYFEVMRHNLDKEKKIEHKYLNIALEFDIPIVATNKVLFSDISMYDSHDILLCIADGVTKEHNDRRRQSNQCYFKSSAEMIELFKDLPSAIINTVEIAKRCSFMVTPRDPMLPSFELGSSITQEDYLRDQTLFGLKKRLSKKLNIALNDHEYNNLEITHKNYFDRLNYELEIICKMQFSGYFLIVSDFIKWSKDNNISVGPGRGSGAGSIVAWCLDITDLDPIEFGLIFERFLNPERISMPDFDIDFCQERRNEVINYVRTKYGESRVAQIITFGKMQAKAVIKDVARVLSLSYKYADRLTELVPFNAVNPVTLQQAIEEVSELNSAYNGKGLYNLQGEEELIKQVLDASLILEGLHRHTSVHAAGVVISGTDLIEMVPLYKDSNSDMNIIQYSMKFAEIAGLMKFDFLGLQTLTVISKCLELLKKRNIHIDFTIIGYNDKKTYDMLSTGAGTGVFQFESAGMKDTLRRLKPDCIQDIIALGALYRPGPMENIPIYIACKHGLQKPDYLYPSLESVLQETYGVIIYQEQVLEIARKLAGYTLGSADLLRRAMGKKIKSEMEAQEEMFVKGAINNGINEQTAKSIFITVAKFAGYGFNKAHASAYGVISYQTAYLKANFLIEFLVTYLNLDITNNDKINLFIQEAKNNNILIEYPDINVSKGYFSLTDNKIIYAFGAIKNVTVNLGEVIENERESRGSFKSIIDFVERIPSKLLNKRALENLIKAGCFDSLHENRYQLLDSLSQILSYMSSYQIESTHNQMALLAVNSNNIEVLKKIVKSYTKYQLAFQEFEVLGLFAKNHPLSEYKEILSNNNLINSINISDSIPNGASQIRIAGVIQKKDSRMSARGRFIVIQLSDQYGIFDVVIYSDDIAREYASLLDIGSQVIVLCDVFKDVGSIRLTAKSFISLESIINNQNLDLKLHIKNSNELHSIINILKEANNKESIKIQCNIVLIIVLNNNFSIKVPLPEEIKLTLDTINELQKFACS